MRQNALLKFVHALAHNSGFLILHGLLGLESLLLCSKLQPLLGGLLLLGDLFSLYAREFAMGLI